MLRKIIYVPALVLSLAVSQTAISATAGNMGPCPCPGQHMEHMISQLSLTPEQQEKIRTIREQAKADMESNRQQMQDIGQQIKELVKSDKIDEGKLDTLINQKKELFAAKMKSKIMVKNQIYNVLNDQQKAKFSAFMDQMEQKHQDHMKGHMNGNMNNTDTMKKTGTY